MKICCNTKKIFKIVFNKLMYSEVLIKKGKYTLQQQLSSVM